MIGSLGLRYVVVEGPIGVGKTSLAMRLARTWQGQVLKEGADENPFLSRYYENPRAYALSTQLFFLMQRAGQVQALRQADLFAPVWVADFMIDKDRLFAGLTLDRDELDLYERIFAHLTMEAPCPDLVIYLQAPVAVLLERIQGRGRSYESAMEGDYLVRLSEVYAAYFHTFDAAPLLIVNAEEIDFVHREQDYNLLLREIARARSGRHYFNPNP